MCIDQQSALTLSISVAEKSLRNLRLKSHHEMGAMGLGKRFSFALERDAVGARGGYRLGCNGRLDLVLRDKTLWLEAQM